MCWILSWFLQVQHLVIFLANPAVGEILAGFPDFADFCMLSVHIDSYSLDHTCSVFNN